MKLLTIWSVQTLLFSYVLFFFCTTNISAIYFHYFAEKADSSVANFSKTEKHATKLSRSTLRGQMCIFDLGVNEYNVVI